VIGGTIGTTGGGVTGPGLLGGTGGGGGGVGCHGNMQPGNGWHGNREGSRGGVPGTTIVSTTPSGHFLRFFLIEAMYRFAARLPLTRRAGRFDDLERFRAFVLVVAFFARFFRRFPVDLVPLIARRIVFWTAPVICDQPC